MHGAYAPGRGEFPDWRGSCIGVFPYRAVGKRKGTDLIWGWVGRRRMKERMGTRDELVRIHGDTTRSPVGVSLRNTQGFYCEY